ncbi:MAG TPA: hypothetical protein VI636_02290 [Candidatus Angelobacter sp.]
MPENKGNSRVLSRFGARELSITEYDQIGGGFQTKPCTLNPKTCFIDGDCHPQECVPS